MCGRYTLSADPAALVAVFDAELDVAESIVPRYNIAPTQEILIVLEEGDRRIITTAVWGLIPSWAKDRSGSARMINARSETVAEKPSFRAAIRKRRCVIPASGYYEWYRPSSGSKQPFHIHHDALLAIAGIYEYWTDPESGEIIRSAAILTQDATPQLAAIHDRMPVFVEESNLGAWLDPTLADPVEALALTTSLELDAVPVSTAVNNARNQGPELVMGIRPETSETNTNDALF